MARKPAASGNPKGAGRPKGSRNKFPKRVQDEWRTKIKVSAIINRLVNHVLGESIMDTSQVTAANLVLRKVLPDLTATEMKIDDSREPSRQELEQRARAVGMDPDELFGPVH